MVRAIAGVAALVALLFVAGPARAERAAVVRLGGDAGIAEETRREAVNTLLTRLRAEGLDVMPVAEAARRAAGARCEGADCEVRLRAALGVDLLVTVGLWAGPDARALRSVVVGLARDVAYFGSAEVGAAGLAAALEAAFGKARARQTLGPGPWLRVEGEPRGALVIVDGTEWGVVPHEAHLAAGEHRVVVRLDGYVAEDRTVRIGESAAEPVVVSVRLVRVAPVQAPAAPTPARRAAAPRAARGAMVVDRPVVGPLVLGGVGLVGVGVALGGLLRADCRLEHDGRCRVGTVANDTWVLLYGAGGAAAVAGAIVWHLLGGTSRPARATVGLGPGSLYLAGEF